jgi:hypothetical protein
VKKRAGTTAVASTAIEHGIHRACLWALVALLALLAAAGCSTTAPQAEQSGPTQEDSGLIQEAPPTRTLEVIDVEAATVELVPRVRSATEQCPELPALLLQVISSRDPAREAQALGLNVLDDSVQVELILDRQEITFLQQAGVKVGKQVDRKVQAYVPLARLCELAADERVESLRPVSQAETQ